MHVETSTTYLGLQLRNPLIVSACPLTGKLESLLRLQEAGAAAAVLPSLFEEQIEHDEMELARIIDLWALSSPESPDYFPELDTYNTGPDEYLELIADAKRALDMPIIASLNGTTPGGWLRYAGLIQHAGADALEINIYNVPIELQANAAKVESHYAQLVRMVNQEIKLPIAVKIGPYFSSLPHFASRLVEAGADGLVLFNRYLAPDIDLESLRYTPALELSSPAELRIALRWIAILRDQLEISLAATGGAHSAEDVIKALLAGANVVACASVLLARGPEALSDLHAGVMQWMQDRDYQSVNQLCGSMSLKNCPNPEGLQRANYMRALTSFTPAAP